MKNQSVLIIGGSRFIGPHLQNLLVKAGANVTIFNRGNFSNNNPKVTHVKGDRHTDLGLLADKKFDLVFDMYARTGSDTQQLLDTLTFDFLVHMGTVASYSLPITYPVKETHPLGLWFWKDYGKGKAECESVLKKAGIKYASLRPTYVLGPKTRAIGENFIYTKLVDEETFQVPGNGQALICFAFVEEVAASLFKLGSEKITGAFNCAGNDFISLTNLLGEMGKIVGKKPIIEFDPDRDRDKWAEKVFPFANENFIYDNSKLKALGIEFEPLLPRLKKDWLAYYQNNLKRDFTR